MLVEKGRNWGATKRYRLCVHATLRSAFSMRLHGDVGAVGLNEVTARDAVFWLGFQDRIEAVQSRPVSTTGLHVMIHEANPMAETLVSTVNDGLAARRGTREDSTVDELEA